MTSPDLAFEFLKINLPPEKPRSEGIIEFRGPYYNAVSYGYLKDLLDDWAYYVDGYKFAGGSMRLLTKTRVEQIIQICHDFGLYVSTGGFIERVIVQGSKAVDKYLEECKKLGFDVVEVSSGLAPISLEDKIKIIKQVRRLGMKPKPEVTMMVGAGAGTHVAGYETDTKLRSFDEFAEEVAIHLKNSVEMIMVESEGITEDLPPEKWKTDIIKGLVNQFGLRHLMFEAADPPVFKWYLKNFGKDVNLFIDYSQIVEFTAWKTKLWGDPEIWKGRKVNYH